MNITRHQLRSVTMTICGVVGIGVVSSLMIGVKNSAEMLIRFPQIWLGIISFFLLAILMPKRIQVMLDEKVYLRPLFGMYVFLVGSAIGSLANVAFSQGMNFFDYFVKPMYWLSIYGIPCAMVIGFTYVGWNNAQQDNARDAASRRP